MNNFREERPRAHELSDKKPVKHVSQYVKGSYPGKTLYVYRCPRTGKILDFNIYIGRFSEGNKMPINIELESGISKEEINTFTSVGNNKIMDLSVEEGDLLFVKARDMDDYPFKAETVTISFDLK